MLYVNILGYISPYPHISEFGVENQHKCFTNDVY